MRLTDIRIKLTDNPGDRLKAFCALTFDGSFVVRDVKLIDGQDGLFLAMPSRKLSDHCGRCGEKNHLRSRFCNHCGQRLNENRYLNRRSSPQQRLKLYADIAHPISMDCRDQIENEVVNAYRDELDRSRQPGYVPPNLDAEDWENDAGSFRSTGIA